MMEFTKFNTIGDHEVKIVSNLLRHDPLSGFLGGNLRSNGYWIQRLEAEWAEAFNVKHAIACNSATSGLLAACVAADVGRNSKVLTTPYTMSATAAVPAFLGADITFGDINRDTFCLDPNAPRQNHWDTVIVTNLFGQPSYVSSWMSIAKDQGAILIEDNAQAPFAQENGKYTGTIGHIGVFSLNIHKHIQVGEGGIITTNDDGLAIACRRFINHGEMAGYDCGLNLRMTEYTAAMACVQLAKGPMIIQERIEQAEAIIEAVKGIEGIIPPLVWMNDKHVYYVIPFLVDGIDRHKFIEDTGIPLIEGYGWPLYNLDAFQQFKSECPVTEDVEQRLFYFENVAWSPTKEQIKAIGDAFHKAREKQHEHSWT